MTNSPESRMDEVFNRVLNSKIELVDKNLVPRSAVALTRLSYGVDIRPEHIEGFVFGNKRFVADYNEEKRLDPKTLKEQAKIDLFEKVSVSNQTLYKDKNNIYYTEQGFPLVDISTIKLFNDKYFVPASPQWKNVDFSPKNVSIDDKGDIITNDFVIYKKEGDLYYRSDDRKVFYNKKGEPFTPLINEQAVTVINFWRTPSQVNQNVIVDSFIDPKKSDRAFYLRLNNPALKGQEEIRVTLKVSDPDNPQKPLESVEIVLKEEKFPSNPGVFRSSALLFTASIQADKESLVARDNSPQDQTFHAKLGSEISISYENIRGEFTTLPIAEVPYQQVLEVQLIVFGEKNYRVAQENFERNIEALQEVLAPAGILIKVNPPLLHEEEPANLAAAMLQASSDYPADRGLRFVATSTDKQNYTASGPLQAAQESPWYKEMQKSILIAGEEVKNPQLINVNVTTAIKNIISAVPGELEQNFRLANETNSADVITNRVKNNVFSNDQDIEKYPLSLTEAQIKVLQGSSLLKPSQIPSLALKP